MKMAFQNNRKGYFSIKLAVGTSIIMLLLSINLSVANNLTVDEHLIGLSDRHGEIFFVAIGSLPETKNIWSKNIGRAEEDECPELSLYETRHKLNERQKKALIDASIRFLKGRKDSKRILTRINHWCIAKRTIEVITSYEGISEDDIFAAIYSNSVTKPIFKSVLENRKFDPVKIDPIVVGGTLASAEREGILCDTLNILSGLTETKLLVYFSDLLRTLSKFKNTKG